MNLIRTSIVIALLMAGSAVLSVAARPATKGNDGAAKYLLEEIVPKRFGDWTLTTERDALQVVNPQTQALLDSVYSQTLTRTYANSQGYRIMLSLAYGDDQRGDLQVHKPEFCYPAQGFDLITIQDGELATAFGSIPVRRLDTRLGARQEPVTYWIAVDDKVVTNKVQRRMIEIQLGLTGRVPGGLLFRLSSIDVSTNRAFKLQDSFVADLLKTVSPVDRRRLSGLVNESTAQSL